MCRLIIFSGTCTRCSDAQAWLDLSQELSCLEAKNEGMFGECVRGINVDERDFDQECDRCVDEDEGVGDLDGEFDMELDTGVGYDLRRGVADESALVLKRPVEADEGDEGARKRQRTDGSTTGHAWAVTAR